MNKDAVIIIPSRLASERLSKKPLQKISGKPIIQWVAEQATKANLCDVCIACCCEEISNALEKNGFSCILTDPNLKSGTDRVFAAYQTLNESYDFIINLQGDMPFIQSKTIESVYNAIKKGDVDIATAATQVNDSERLKKLSVVEAIVSKTSRALYFTRYYDARKYEALGENVSLLEHIGIYAYKRSSLKKFASLKQSPLETLEKLEQLRALENNMSMSVSIVSDPHISVDTMEDLEVARRYYNSIKNEYV